MTDIAWEGAIHPWSSKKLCRGREEVLWELWRETSLCIVDGVT